MVFDRGRNVIVVSIDEITLAVLLFVCVLILAFSAIVGIGCDVARYGERGLQGTQLFLLFPYWTQTRIQDFGNLNTTSRCLKTIMLTILLGLRKMLLFIGKFGLLRGTRTLRTTLWVQVTVNEF